MDLKSVSFFLILGGILALPSTLFAGTIGDFYLTLTYDEVWCQTVTAETKSENDDATKDEEEEEEPDCD
jgi:hypothetical protein